MLLFFSFLFSKKALFCVIAFVSCQTCEVAEPIDPLAGIDLSDDDIEKNPYPE